MTLFKKLSRKSFLIIIIVSVAIVLACVFYFGFKNFVKKDSQIIVPAAPVLIEKKEILSGLPLRLKIPSIKIDAPVEYVGVTATGAMDIPKAMDQVGWFKLGQLPGDIGTAVIAGHYGLYAGKPTVFNDLNKLKKGDKIFIENDKAETISFVVRESRSYDPKADTLDIFSSDDERSHLNLITCEGIWNKDAKSFPKRLVIFADKE